MLYDLLVLIVYIVIIGLPLSLITAFLERDI